MRGVNDEVKRIKRAEGTELERVLSIKLSAEATVTLNAEGNTANNLTYKLFAEK